MIGYNPLTGTDLRWYWDRSTIFVHTRAGYVPYNISRMIDEDYENMDIRDLPDRITLDLSMHRNAYDYKVADYRRREIEHREPAKELPPAVPTLTVRPSVLFENNQDFITYQPSLGYVSCNSTVVWLEARAPRNRSKGIVMAGNSSIFGKRIPRGPWTETEALAGLCIRLDGNEDVPTRKRLIRVVSDTTHIPAILSPRVVVVGNTVRINEVEIATLDVNLNVECDSESARKMIERMISNLQGE